jgi:methionyl-tRNA synthetase
MKYYVTTPIYYPSGKLHLGHVYSTVSADIINRIRKQQGYESYFLTGMDEHGEKIQKKAEEQGLSPQDLVDNAEKDIKQLWQILDVEYDMFSRTTDEFHVKQVQDIFSKMLEKDDIYLGEYKGLYCVSCETYVTETQAKDCKCPDCGGELKEVTEETYKFRCSKYQDQVREMIEKDIINIEPKSRKNELLSSFFDKGIPDLAVTRTNFSWGIPVKENPKHVIYVWLDALTNYITTPKEKGLDVWPANIQIMGKEITRFHAIYWPMFLLSLDLPMPDKLFAHGWLLMNGEKMSKSKKNVIYPEFLVENYSTCLPTLTLYNGG